MRRLLAGAVALAVLAPALPASAGPVPPDAKSYSAGADVGGGTLQPTIQVTGALAGLLGGILNPLLSTTVNPLVAALQSAAVKPAVDGLLGASSSTKADRPSEQSAPGPSGAFPGDLPGSLPNPCDAASATQPCYSAASTPPMANPLLSVSTGLITGYTQQVLATADPGVPIFGRAAISNLGITALGLSAVTANKVDARANCPTASGSPTAQISATSVSLLAGRAVLNLGGSDSVATVTVSGTPVSLPSLPTSGPVSRYGSAVRVTASVSPAALFTALGIPAPALPVSGSLTLTVIAGPDRAVTANSAQAWGLGVGIDLSGSITVDLGLGVGVTLSIPSGIGGGQRGNVIDLRLAYASCEGRAASQPTPWIPRSLQ